MIFASKYDSSSFIYLFRVDGWCVIIWLFQSSHTIVECFEDGLWMKANWAILKVG